jgi:predicted CxxxxCH...CXXCH cytochrome family protein
MSGGAAALARPSIAIAIAAALPFASCSEERAPDVRPPVYDADVAPILARACAACHDGPGAAAGWRVTSFLDVIGCVGDDQEPAVKAHDVKSPILRVLDTDSHRDFLDSASRSVLTSWIGAGAHAFQGTVHSAEIADPRAAGWHGKLLRDQRWAPMLDPGHAEACGRCHDGAPARPAGVMFPAPHATACTSCHGEPGGVLACGTCHGQDGKAFPPRDTCFFPGDRARAGAHAAHAEPSATSAEGLPCSACHPTPAVDVMSGLHGNGGVEIIFDDRAVGSFASYDRSTGVCAVVCHDRGGARARPGWGDSMAMRCGDCHGAPPRGHYPGPCNQCHFEVDPSGSHLTGQNLHLNGRVDLGDGSGTCGACHGSGDDAWPRSAAHGAHAAPTVTTSVACGDCHRVPRAVRDQGHLDGVVEVVFAGRAVERGARAAWDGRSCRDVACHGAELVDPPPVLPVWADASGAARACGACHRLPPTGHTASGGCDRAECHGSEIIRSGLTLSISESGKLLHVNGVVNASDEARF